jgi:hypothetical protein
MRSTTVVVGALIFCAIAPSSAKAKTDHSKCEDRCREYYCTGGISRQFYCDFQCHKRCSKENGESRFDATLNAGYRR